MIKELLAKLREAAAAPAATDQSINLREDRNQPEVVIEEKEGKRHLVVTLMREGPGNQRDMNYYHRTALESLVAAILKRPKQYANHAKDPEDRDMRDWMSSVKEAWVENGSDGLGIAKARVRVYDGWLWDRAKQAPDELALSVEGRGAGKREKIGEQDYNGIYGITALNGVHWVDYPGNAGMGVTVVEKEAIAAAAAKEEAMDFQALIEKLKTATPEEKAQLADALGVKATEGGVSQAVVEKLQSEVTTMKSDAEKATKALTEKLTAVEADKAALANKVEAHELREKDNARERLVDGLLKASRLKEQHVTAQFRGILLSVRETKKGDVVIGEEAQMKELIKDRETIALAEKADPNAPAAAASLSIAEKAIAFSKRFLGFDTTEVYKHADLVGEESVLKS